MKNEITKERARMASYLNMHFDPKYWDFKLIDKMLDIESRKGQKGLIEEFQRIFVNG